MLNAAVVGLGRWGQRLVEALASPPSEVLRFTHAVVRTPGSAAEFCERHGLRLVPAERLDALLAERSVSALVLATPHSQHADQVIRAARAGKHVFCEKPFTLDLESACAAVEACREAGVVLALGHNRRFLPAMAEMKEIIDSGELGEILHAEGAFSGNFGFGYLPGMWRATQRESPAGGMTAMGIHIIDAFIHLVGPIASVRCESHRRVLSVDLDDTTSAFMRFRNGATGYLSTLTATGRIVRVQVFGTRGWLHLLDHHILERCDVEGNVSRREFPRVDSERLELEAFGNAIARRQPYQVSIDEAVHGVAVMQAAFRSAREDGERVAVEEATCRAQPVAP
ncbi:MAG TPA: Gfo/Idh/MocA family oxidoreductase [Burkholderiales bacterium]